MSSLSYWLSNDLLMIVVVSVCAFIISYAWSDKVLDYFSKKTLNNKTEVLKLLDLMFVETEEKKISTLMYLISFGLGLVVFLLLLPNVIAGFILATIVVIAGWSVPVMVVRNLYENRCNKFVEQMVDGLTIMANGIKSGLTVTQAMERVVENLGNPISQEFNLVLSQIRLGRSVEEGLIELGERVPRPDVQMFVTAINILKETGGNLAETFSTICLTIRERQKIEKKIQAMTAQGLMQGMVITMVPFALMILFSFINPGYIGPMFNTTLGLIFLCAMFALQVLGGITIRKIVKIKV